MPLRVSYMGTKRLIASRVVEVIEKAPLVLYSTCFLEFALLVHRWLHHDKSGAMIYKYLRPRLQVLSSPHRLYPSILMMQRLRRAYTS